MCGLSKQIHVIYFIYLNSYFQFSGDASDCYIVGGSVCGDSIVTLARIGWVDSWARKRIGDVSTFEKLLLEPLQRDLVENTW